MALLQWIYGFMSLQDRSSEDDPQIPRLTAEFVDPRNVCVAPG